MKKFLFAILIGIALLMPSASFAAEEKFFEYATDVGTPVDVPTGSIAIQEFKVYNDYMNAVDIWFDNIGASGSATFALLDSAGNTLASTGVSIPHADPFYTGQRLHVKFTKTISINSGSWYRLRITSTSPDLRLYAIKRVQFVEHNAPYPADYSVGGSSLGGEPQFAVFKFALYEEADTVPPVITNASTTIAGPDTVTISFNANELVDRMLTYGPIGSGIVSTVGYTGNYSICFEGVYACPITIATQRNMVYAYRLTARDSWGNESYVDGAFESWKPGTPVPLNDASTTPPTPTPPSTPPTPETPPIEPLTINNATIVSVTRSAIMVSWDTNRAANSLMTVSTDPVEGTILKTVSDGTQELSHVLATPDILGANTPYYVTIVSHDEGGAVVAKVMPFTTLGKAATTTLPAMPDMSGQSLQVSVSADQQSLSVTWKGSVGGMEPTGGYRVDVIDGQGNLVQSKTVASGIHAVTLPGLTGGEYHAVVYANNNGVFEKVAEPAVAYARRAAPPIDTYELIKKPIIYIPFTLFVMLIGGLFWYDRRQKETSIKK